MSRGMSSYGMQRHYGRLTELGTRCPGFMRWMTYAEGCLDYPPY